MKQIYVIRHCSATGQSPGAQLTTEGTNQANRLCNFLVDKKIELIVCSPYIRACQTIEPLVRQSNIPIHLESRLAERVLSERNLDDWLECLKRTFQDFDLAFEGGESSRTAMARAVEVVQEIVLNGPETVALVTHGNLMTLLLSHFDSGIGFDDWSALYNPDVFLVTIDGNRSTVTRAWPG